MSKLTRLPYFVSNVAWELVDFLHWSMVYAKDFGTTLESARRALNKFKEEANSDKVTSFWQNSSSFLNMLRTAVDLNTNKILNRVSDLHDDVSQTIFNKVSELVFMKKSRKNHHQKKRKKTSGKKIHYLMERK
ncbi:hypothetical protein C1645_448335 [Glomus cerebriforme]|uniref:Uncharacterized protein n=1 Tax=Glomus cerebriforme TaxID=658196 RepID=A0A397SBR0_9GLOM|nr:hypothetical protein C1645_448335 [Glomus cerebriforme]